MGQGEKSLKARFKEADRLGAAYVAIIGEDEVRDGTVTIREMGQGRQKTIMIRGLEDEAIGALFFETTKRLMEEKLT